MGVNNRFYTDISADITTRNKQREDMTNKILTKSKSGRTRVLRKGKIVAHTKFDMHVL